MIVRLAPDPRTTPLPQERGPRRGLAFGVLLLIVCVVATQGGAGSGPPARAATTYTVTRSVPVGASPTAVAYDAVNHRAFVQNAIPSGGGIPTISVVNDTTGAVTTAFPTPQLPVDLAYEPVGDDLYVAQRNDQFLPPPPPPPGPAAVGGSFSVLQEVNPGRLDVFDASTSEMQSSFIVGAIPTGLDLDANRGLAWVSVQKPCGDCFNGVLGINPALGAISFSYSLPNLATSVAVDTSTHRIYATGTNFLSTSLLPLAGTLTMIEDPQVSNTTVPINVGTDPVDVALDVSARRAYVVNGGAGGSVSVVNLDTNQVVRTVNVPGARKVAVDPIGDVYVTGSSSNSVTVLRVGDLGLLATLPVPGAPEGVAVDPAGHRGLVTTAGGGQLVTITRGTTTPTTPTTAPPRPATTVAAPVTTVAVATTVPPTTRAPTTTTAAPTTTIRPTTTLAVVPPPPPPPRPTTTTPRSEKAAARFVDALPSPLETRTEAGELAQDAFLTILFLALLSLPINVVNGIAETNAETLAARTAVIGQRFRARTRGDWIRDLPVPVVLVVAALVSAVLYGFLQPAFGLDEPSLALVLGVGLAVLMLNAVQRLVQIAWLRRFNASAFLRLLPGFLLVAFVCVLLSRMIGLQPGLLLGPLATVGLRDELPQEKQGQALAVSYTAVAVFGLIAWFTRSTVVNAFDAATLPGEVVGVAWTTLAVACTETVAFNMIPLRFLDGFQVFTWSKAAWASLTVFGLYGFVHVLINPSGGAGAFTGRTQYLGILLAIYLVLAGAFWAFFRFRGAGVSAPPPQPPPTATPPPTPQPQPPAQNEDSMQATWRAMQGSGWPGR